MLRCIYYKYFLYIFAEIQTQILFQIFFGKLYNHDHTVASSIHDLNYLLTPTYELLMSYFLFGDRCANTIAPINNDIHTLPGNLAIWHTPNHTHYIPI